MQQFIAKGNVSKLNESDFRFNAKGNGAFKFDFVTDSNYILQETGEKLPIFFHVEIYGKQAEICAESLSVGSPILLSGEIIKRPYKDEKGENRYYEFIMPDIKKGITFLEGREASNLRKTTNIRKNENKNNIDEIPLED